MRRPARRWSRAQPGGYAPASITHTPCNNLLEGRGFARDRRVGWRRCRRNEGQRHQLRAQHDDLELKGDRCAGSMVTPYPASRCTTRKVYCIFRNSCSICRQIGKSGLGGNGRGGSLGAADCVRLLQEALGIAMSSMMICPKLAGQAKATGGGFPPNTGARFQRKGGKFPLSRACRLSVFPRGRTPILYFRFPLGLRMVEELLASRRFQPDPRRQIRFRHT